MTRADDADQVHPDDVTLTNTVLGYDILVDGERAGAIEGIPGRLEYIEIEMHWEGKGVARAALDRFAELSRDRGVSELTTNNTTHPAMEHILGSEGFEQQSDGVGWVKDL